LWTGLGAVGLLALGGVVWAGTTGSKPDADPQPAGAVTTTTGAVTTTVAPASGDGPPNGRPVVGSNTLGWTVEGTGWRQFGAIHPTSVTGSQLALEIMARDLPPGGFLDVDEVVLHLLGSRS
jgi:hypothetical protein